MTRHEKEAIYEWQISAIDCENLREAIKLFTHTQDLEKVSSFLCSRQIILQLALVRDMTSAASMLWAAYRIAIQNEADALMKLEPFGIKTRDEALQAAGESRWWKDPDF